MNGAKNGLCAISALGQSIWLDDLERRMLEDGSLERMVREDCVSGITSNPTIFNNAMGREAVYDAAIAELARQGASPGAAFEALALADVGRAADLLKRVFERTGGRDGFVSLEVAPGLAHDVDGTVEEARRLWQALSRPNIMIKVPGTRAGLESLRRLTAEGVNVNVTLLFSVARYAEVCDAWMAGLEERVAAGRPVDRLASVASFFISRVDTLVDARLDARRDAAARGLRGKAAIACARLAYQHYRSVIAGERWQRLASRGARSQRLLWASTSTKDPAYGPTRYVEALVAPDTVTTLPPQTLAAARALDAPHVAIEEDLDEARALEGRLAGVGIDLAEVAAQLEAEGIEKFAASFDELHATLAVRLRTYAAA